MASSSPFTIRRGNPSDVTALAAFQEAMAVESEGKVLDRTTLEAGIRGLLDRPAAGWYLLAVQGENRLGSLMITPEWSDWRCGWWWWVQSVYVAPSGRRRGVYSALYDHVRSEAREAGDVVGVRLYVERDNAAAIRTYEKLGMARSPYLMFEANL